MIIAVTEQFHDYPVRKFKINSEKLNSNNYVDVLILKEITKKKDSLEVYVDASDWEENPIFNNQLPEISEEAKCKSKSIDKTLYLSIDFDC